ncbi:MAG: hypothetical protein H8D34_05635 [Chloroflexi bacterium]|nr:hypothetical protein [Chloroflexota bacterium]
MSTNILIVADFLDIQPYIEVSISDDASLKIIGFAQNQEATFNLCDKYNPDLILLSDRLQGGKTLGIISNLLDKYPVILIVSLIFSQYPYRIQATEKSAHGSVFYQHLNSDLLPEIHRVLQNNIARN